MFNRINVGKRDKHANKQTCKQTNEQTNFVIHLQTNYEQKNPENTASPQTNMMSIEYMENEESWQNSKTGKTPLLVR